MDIKYHKERNQWNGNKKLTGLRICKRHKEIFLGDRGVFYLDCGGDYKTVYRSPNSSDSELNVGEFHCMYILPK